MNIEERKQLDTIILEEVNIENYDREFGCDESGKRIALRFDGNNYFWLVGDERREIRNISCVMEIIDSFE